MKNPGSNEWERMIIYMGVAVVLLLALILITGCSMASVTEYYERTPTHVESVGEGYIETHGKKVMVKNPFWPSGSPPEPQKKGD